MVLFVFILPQSAEAIAPKVNLQRNIYDYSNSVWIGWSDGGATIEADDSVSLRWNSDEADSCSGSGFDTSADTGTGHFANLNSLHGEGIIVAKPTVGNHTTYTITCTGDGGAIASDSLIVASISFDTSPIVTLQQNIYSNGGWSGWSEGDATINVGDIVILSWTSVNATRCTGTGSGFSTGYDITTSGEDTSITEPAASNATTYTVSCIGSGGTDDDDLTITTTPQPSTAPTVTLEKRQRYYIGTDPDNGWVFSDWSDWSTSDGTVTNTRDEVALRWSSTNATGCTGSSYGGVSGGFDPTDFNTTINGTDHTIFEPLYSVSVLTYIVTCTSAYGVSTSAHITINIITPTATLEKSINGGDWSIGDGTISSGDSISLRWSSTNADSCFGSYSDFDRPTDDGFNVPQDSGNVRGVDTNILEPQAGNSNTYTITCYRSDPSSYYSQTSPYYIHARDSDSLTITNTSPPTDPPTATLEASTDNGNTYSTGDTSIEYGDQVSLKWKSKDATGCIGTGSGFYTLGDKSGEDDTITEPDADNSTTYTVECTGPGGTASSSLTITTKAVVIFPPIVTLKKRILSNGNWSGWSEGDAEINVGNEVHLQWSSTSTASCSGSPSGDFDTGDSTSGTDDIYEPAAGNSTTYTVTCIVN